MWSWLFSSNDENQYEYNHAERNYMKELFPVYGNKYDYSKIRIRSKHDKVVLVCSRHGNFSGTQYCILLGKGCPMCSKAKRLELLFDYYSIGKVKRKILL
jgi:hypothetical protein